MHEASLHVHNSFITLTYAPEYLPKDGSLVKKDFQDFMKRLRFHSEDVGSSLKQHLLTAGEKVRFFMCGEYGDRLGRPHYHACLFGLDFGDLRYLKTVNGFKYYTSKTLEALWEGKGHCVVGRVTFESAAYVARYCTKKVTGEAAADHYNVVDYSTGEILLERIPEYTTMSRRPGIAREWLNKFSSDVYPSDECVVRGVAQRPPKYYDRMFEISCPETMEAIKDKRSLQGKARASDNTPARLRVKEKVLQSKFKQLKRGFEKC